MNSALGSIFALLAGYGYIQVGLLGMIGCLLGGAASAVVWLLRGHLFKALPGAVVALLVVLIVLGNAPELESVAVLLALIAAVLVFLGHLRQVRSDARHLLDTLLTLVLGLSLFAVALAYILGFLFHPQA